MSNDAIEPTQDTPDEQSHQDAAQQPGKGDAAANDRDHARLWEQRARQNKAELDAVKAQRQQYEATLAKLRSAFLPDEQGAKPEDITRALTDRLDAFERQTEVERLARRYEITDDEDVEILAEIRDPQRREAAAKRLRNARSIIPPDPGQGVRQGTPASDAEADYERFYPNPNRK